MHVKCADQHLPAIHKSVNIYNQQQLCKQFVSVTALFLRHGWTLILARCLAGRRRLVFQKIEQLR